MKDYLFYLNFTFIFISVFACLFTLRSVYASGEQGQGGDSMVALIAPLQVSCSASPNPARIDENVSFIANVSGGNGFYTYLWSGACRGFSPVCHRSFSAAGTYTAYLLVISGLQSKSTFCSVRVNQPPPPPPLSVSCNASPNPANVNQTVSFIANVSGGSSSYTYNWSGDCIGSSQICSRNFPLVGTYTANLTVTSGTQSKSTSCSVRINANLPIVITSPAVESL